MTDSKNDIVLITGSNKGLGFEAARQLSEKGWTVYLGARDPELGTRAASELAANGGDVRFVPIDVTSDESVPGAVAAISAETDHLDVLINNAGIIGARKAVVDTGPDDFLACYGVNVLGPVRVTHAFLGLLGAAELPRIVNVSSGLGSMTITNTEGRTENSFTSLVYPSSKSALNMITTQYARALPDWKINAVDPGYTATDLNGHSGRQTVAEGTEAIITLATIGADGPTGGYFDRFGPVPW